MGNVVDVRVCVFSVCSGRRYVEMCNAGVCSFRCAAGGGMWRWITWVVLISVFRGMRHVEMCNAGDMWVFVHFGVQQEEVSEDG